MPAVRHLGGTELGRDFGVQVVATSPDIWVFEDQEVPIGERRVDKTIMAKVRRLERLGVSDERERAICDRYFQPWKVYYVAVDLTKHTLLNLPTNILYVLRFPCPTQGHN